MMNTRQDNRNSRGSARRIVRKANSRRIRKTSLFSIIACWLLLSVSPVALSQNAEGAEYLVKLAFLYNFTKFVEWPPDSYGDPSAPLVICVVGHDPFSQNLEGELRTRTVGSHPVDVRTLRPNDKLSACHIVFVPATEKGYADTIVNALKGIKGSDGWRIRGIRCTGWNY